MKSFINDNKKIFGIMIFVLSGIMLLALFYLLISNIDDVFENIINIFRRTVKIFNPVITGGIIAYLLKRPCEYIYKYMTVKNMVKDAARRNAVSVFVAYILFCGAVVMLFVLIIPNTVNNVSTLFSRLKELREPFENALVKLYQNKYFRYVAEFINLDLSNVSLNGMYKIIADELKLFVLNRGSQVYNLVEKITEIIYNGSAGFVIAIYIGLERKLLAGQFRKLLSVLFGRHYHKIRDFVLTADKIFTDYFVIKVISSFALGGVSSVLAFIFGVPYPLTIGVIIGVFNLIPIFGPWIGGVICVLITLLSGINKAFAVAIISIAAQFIDANAVQPLILGSGINLSGFWSFTSVVVAGNFAGVAGMVLSMPLFALIKEYMGRILKISNKNDEK